VTKSYIVSEIKRDTGRKSRFFYIINLKNGCEYFRAVFFTTSQIHGLQVVKKHSAKSRLFTDSSSALQIYNAKYSPEYFNARLSGVTRRRKTTMLSSF